MHSFHGLPAISEQWVTHLICKQLVGEAMIDFRTRRSTEMFFVSLMVVVVCDADQVSSELVRASIQQHVFSAICCRSDLGLAVCGRS